jgi:hypothetical protein
MASDHEYRLRVGRRVIGLVCEDPAFAASFEPYFDQPSDPAEPDVQLALHLVSHVEDPPVPNSLIVTKTVGPDGFDIADGLIRGRYDPATGRGELHVKTILTNGMMTRVFEQILYQAFHSACQRRQDDAGLVHSASVIHRGAGFLFVGPSEAGKSTIARLSQQETVLNDEMSLVEFMSNDCELVGTPFNGFFRDKQPGRAPLAAVLLLQHGPEHRLEPVGSGEAAAAVATQVAPPVGLDQAATIETRVRMLETASRIVQAVPIRRLVFTPDAGFWPLLTTEFTSQ